ncbi:MAG: GTP 3',8-cyclase [Burkholderia sp.]|jgi:GTP 3',8-cyclase
MSSKTIPISSAVRSLPIPQTGAVTRSGGHWRDRRGRPLRDLRISVTDHCNFRCRYCMPKEKFADAHAFLAHTELLSFEEILRISRIAVANGIEKLRLTGGEPLLRKGVEGLVAELAKLRTPQGGEVDLAMTTNASIFHKKAEALKKAGLRRVTISLDAIDEEIFQGFNDVGFPAAKVLENIDLAVRLGFRVKVNTVVKRGVNEGEIVRICERFRGTPVIPRFIEYMDVGNANGWRMTDVVPSAEVVRLIASHWPCEPIGANYPGETAKRWRYKDGAGEFGCISSVTQAFCGECSRARLSMDGRLYLCLFADEGYDLRTMLRGGATDAEIEEAIGRIWSARENHYSELRSLGIAPTRSKIEMSYIGG